MACDSGILRGRTVVCSVLYMAALVATSRHNPAIGAFYGRLITAGKAGKLARAAAMRKLLVILNAMLRDGTMRDDSRMAVTMG